VALLLPAAAETKTPGVLLLCSVALGGASCFKEFLFVVPKLKAERVGAVQPGEAKVAGRPYCSLPVPEGAYKKAREGLFTRACSHRTRGNGFKLKEGRFQLDIRNKFFTMRVGRHWNRLPRKAVAAPSLDVFKARLDEALSGLV